MSVTIEYHGMRATVEGQVWTSDVAALAMFLNAQRIEDMSASDPFPDYTLAHHIVARFGATIINVNKPEIVPGRVY